MITTKKDLENFAKKFNTAKDFDSVMAYYDILEIKKNLRGRTILEMGTSGGTVSKYLVHLADSVDIVEGSQTGIQRTKELIGDTNGKVHYIHELWENYKPTKKYSDIIFIRGLEHVEDAPSLLCKMKNMITDDGRIHIIVPNAKSLHRRVMCAQGKLSDLYALRDRDYQVGHVRVYDMKQLQEHVTLAGLKVKNAKGFFMKNLSTSEMGKITMDPEHPFVRACYTAGKLFPDLGTQLYIVGEKK